MKERITVEARFEAEGRVQPLAFEWRGLRFRVASVGRAWQEASERRFLVMTPEEQVYELAYAPEPAAGQWWLLRVPKGLLGGTLA